MNDAIDERVFEASVLAALNRVRAEQDAFPDPCVAIQQELSLIEAQSQRLLDLMGDGKGSAFMVQELDGLRHDRPNCSTSCNVWTRRHKSSS